MAQENTANNGARAKILRALLKQGMLTTKEISDETGLTSRQVIDNANQARVAGLCKSGRDDVTRLMGYQITDTGRKWLETNSKPASEPVIETPAAVKESLTAQEPLEVATTKESSSVAAEEATDEAPAIAEAFVVESLDEDPEADQEIPDEPSSTADPHALPEATSAPEEDRDLYVVFGASMPVPEIAGPTLENAQQQCISLAFDSGCDLTLYRLVPVGQTRTSVTFVSQ